MLDPSSTLIHKIGSGIIGTIAAVVVIGFATGLIPPPKRIHADSSRIVSIYYDGQKKVITTEASTVGEALREAGVGVQTGDSVEPAASSTMPIGFFNVNVYRSRPVLVTDGAAHKLVQSPSQTPALVAKTAGFTVYPEDTFSVSTIQNITTNGAVGQEIDIHRATAVNVTGDGTNTTVRTQKKTVGELLTERDVAFGPQDSVTPTAETPISPNMTISINRVKVVVIKQNDVIPHATTNVNDPNLDAGTTKTQVEGKDGQQVSTFRVHYQNGVEQSRDALGTAIIAQPVTKVVVVGTKVNYSANPVELGKQLAAQRGWTDGQWNSLYQLWNKESGWNPNSNNVFSGACGIPQAYPCSKIKDHSTAGQINWGLSYIAGKYGDPNTAWAYWQRNHSY